MSKPQHWARIEIIETMGGPRASLKAGDLPGDRDEYEFVLREDYDRLRKLIADVVNGQVNLMQLAEEASAKRSAYEDSGYDLSDPKHPDYAERKIDSYEGSKE